MYTVHRTRLARTDHYLRRCRERGFPVDAADVARRRGRPLPSANVNETHYWISPYIAWRADERGVNLWRYRDVLVVVVRGAAVTVYRISEEEAYRRLSEAS